MWGGGADGVYSCSICQNDRLRKTGAKRKARAARARDGHPPDAKHGTKRNFKRQPEYATSEQCAWTAAVPSVAALDLPLPFLPFPDLGDPLGDPTAAARPELGSWLVSTDFEAPV